MVKHKHNWRPIKVLREPMWYCPECEMLKDKKGQITKKIIIRGGKK